jgi:hypothetical protein
MNSLITILLILVFVVECLSDVYEMSRAEAEHSGLPFMNAAITTEFMISDQAKNSRLNNNDYISHHETVSEFCKSRKTGCSWKDYYNILDHIRLPYVKLFDPGQERVGTPLRTLQNSAKSGYRHQQTCEVIDEPSASTFYRYVLGSKPVIIRGLVPKLRPSDWSFEKLLQLIGDVEVYDMQIYIICHCV